MFSRIENKISAFSLYTVVCAYFTVGLPEFFRPGDDTLELLSEGYISTDSVNTCDDCWDLIELSENDLIESFSDADPGL
ncbi:MAG: hypothetical protein LLG13_18815 [Bacteroidales bacterium]|nr:hypothetical protein [Bacteroidales bacterium]